MTQERLWPLKACYSATAPYARDGASRSTAPVENGQPAQTIQFSTAGDGVKVAYALAGSGATIVKAANWLSHLEYDWQSPVWRHWFAFFTRGNRILRYDSRGCGLSDWTDQSLAIEHQVSDLERIVDAAGAERFPLFGMSQGAAIAIEYAVRHPSRASATRSCTAAMPRAGRDVVIRNSCARVQRWSR